MTTKLKPTLMYYVRLIYTFRQNKKFHEKNLKKNQNEHFIS